jgi:hypothetical protein
MTIMKYLWSSNDDPLRQRSEFLSPEAKFGSLCTACGRSCDCGAKL